MTLRREGQGGEPVPALAVAGAVLVPDASGALWWPDEALLVVADLHLEKGSALAGRGVLLPPYDTPATLDRLAAVIARLRPRTLVALGDSFHDVRAGDRLAADSRARIADLQRARDWIWIAGNHDPVRPADIGGDWYDELSIGALTFRHEPAAASPGPEIAGHLHPVARLRLRGRGVRRRCFAGDGRRLVMPAFGAYAGGLNVLDRAYAGLFAPGSLAAWMLGGTSVYPVPAARLLPD